MASTQYYAGLVDGQLSIAVSKPTTAVPEPSGWKAIRVTLASNDARVAEELTAKFRPTRVTIVKRPGKKDLCTALFVGSDSKDLLDFAAEHCVIKKELASKTLEYVASTATAEDVKGIAPMTELEDVSLDWASGFFDVRGVVIHPVSAIPETDDTPATKKRRGAVRLVLPKHEKYLIPALQKILKGKVKKNSPCRLVYETQDAINAFVDTVCDHVRAKKVDLEGVIAY